MQIGYTAGTFDLLHVGHINILKRARSLCDRLIVGVSTDRLVEDYKHKTPVYPFQDRCLLVESVRYVDAVVPQVCLDKFEAWMRLHFNVLFVADDWYGNDSWKIYEESLSKVGVPVVYLPYTSGISSSIVRDTISKESKDVEQVS